jgi:hypothetical protein
MRLALSLLFAAACGNGGDAADLGADLGALADGSADFSAGAECPTAPASCSCPAPDPAHVCLAGSLYDFVSNQPTAPSGPLRVSVYDPKQYLANPATPPLGCSLPAAGCFVIQDIAVPSSGLLVLHASDDAWVPAGQRDYVGSATNLEVVAGTNYRADVYLISRALMAKWMSSASLDFVRNGAVLFQFMEAARPADPYALGVSSWAAGIAVDGARYLDARDDVGPATLASTQASAGAAIMFPPFGLPSLGGTADGGRSCGAAQIATSLPNVVYILDFYCD